MTKDNKDTRLMGQKAYLFSRNLKVPEKIVNHNLKDFYNLEKKIYKLDNLKPEYVSNFTSELMGGCVYKQYNLKRSNYKL